MSYKTTQLPKHLVEEVDRVVREHPELGYTSRQSFIVEAVRRRIETIRKPTTKEVR